MQFKHVLISRHAMQAVYILRDEGELGNPLFEFDKRVMPGVGARAFDGFAPPRVPIPDEFGIAGKRIGRGEVFGLVLRPQAGLRVAEGAESAFLRGAGSSQRDQFDNLH